MKHWQYSVKPPPEIPTQEEITFSNPTSSCNSISHLGDALGGGSDGDSETIICDLKSVNRRVYCIMLVATASTGTFDDVEVSERMKQRKRRHTHTKR